MQLLSSQFGIDKSRVGSAPYIFLSYAHVDAKKVFPYFAALQQAGMDIWFDDAIRAGAEWEREIIQYLSAANGFLFFVTEASLKSRNCRDELFSARDKGKVFINILMEDIDLSNPEYEWFKFRFSRYQQIPAYAMSMEEVISKIQRGLEAVNGLAKNAATVTRRPVPQAKRKSKPQTRQKPPIRLKDLSIKRLAWLGATAACLLYAAYFAVFETVAEAVAMGLIALVTAFFAYDVKDFKIENSVLKKYKGWAAHVIIPNKTTEIGESAFAERGMIQSIVIPASVTVIGNSAFSWCKALTDITIPNSVRRIGSSAFCQCSSLVELEIPNSVVSIGDWAFHGCISLENIHIPNSVVAIDKRAFLGCISLANVHIPKSVKFIREGAFEDCSALSNIMIPDSLVAIEKNAFQGCKVLTSITIPNSVTKMEEGVFDKCTALTTIYCEHPQQPQSWNEHWLGDCTAKVIWGHSSAGGA